MGLFVPCVGLVLTGCALSPRFERPNVDVPDAWNGAAAVPDAVLEKDWWKRFGSDELNGLVEGALAKNTDVQAAVKRIRQAKAQLTVANSTLLPGVDASANAGRTLTRAHGDTNGSNGLSAGATLSYELDLFGGNAAGREGARANVKASRYDKDALALVTARDVSKGYFAVLSLRQRIALAQDSLKNAEEVLRVLQVRLDAGAISELDVAQQRSSVEGSKANLASLQQQEVAARDALAVLEGVTPESLKIAGVGLSSINVPSVSPSQPSVLLERRPDIKTSEAQLMAANADIGAARSALFPSINLSAGDVFAFDPAKNTLDLSAGLLAPIFHAGALHAQVTQANAREAELAQTYRGVVLNAFREVEDALAAAESAQVRQAALGASAQAATRAYELSRVKLDAGAIDMPTLLTAQSAQLSALDSNVQARLDSLNAASDLMAALGGGMEEK